MLLESVQLGRARAVLLFPLGDSPVVRDAAGTGRRTRFDRLSREFQRLNLFRGDRQPFDHDALLEIAALVEPREFSRHVRRHTVPLHVEIGEIQDYGRLPRRSDSLGELIRDGLGEIDLAFDHDVTATVRSQPALVADVIGSVFSLQSSM